MQNHARSSPCPSRRTKLFETYVKKLPTQKKERRLVKFFSLKIFRSFGAWCNKTKNGHQNFVDDKLFLTIASCFCPSNVEVRRLPFIFLKFAHNRRCRPWGHAKELLSNLFFGRHIWLFCDIPTGLKRSKDQHAFQQGQWLRSAELTLVEFCWTINRYSSPCRIGVLCLSGMVRFCKTEKPIRIVYYSDLNYVRRTYLIRILSIPFRLAGNRKWFRPK